MTNINIGDVYKLRKEFVGDLRIRCEIVDTVSNDDIYAIDTIYALCDDGEERVYVVNEFHTYWELDDESPNRKEKDE